jgi:hypothetical protein
LLAEIAGDNDHSDWDLTWLSPLPPPLRENSSIMTSPSISFPVHYSLSWNY